MKRTIAVILTCAAYLAIGVIAGIASSFIVR